MRSAMQTAEITRSMMPLSPERYENLLEEIEDLELMIEVEKRLNEGGPTIPFHEVLAKNGITEADLEGWEDVEFE